MSNNNWISVESGIWPDHCWDVLCLFKKGTYEKYQIGQKHIRNDGKHLWVDSTGESTIDVTHWQPLPPSPTDTILSTKREVDVSEIEANAALIAPGNDSLGAVQRVYDWLKSMI